jgi:peptidyl-prolyl cis-trans isomerase B (cyclophilin B)
MNFKFLIISVVILSGFAGSAFAQQVIQLEPQEFSQEEIDEMKQKAVIITVNSGTFFIEFFPEEAPNTVHNFLELVESGYYDGTVFHRIIPGFMIQGGDPNTKDPDGDQSLWGQGGPGYQINEEFSTLQHDHGIVSMARSNHPDSAGSQFFIVHKDSPHLDGEYTVFGRLVPGLPNVLNHIASLETDDNNVPLDLLEARIITAEILEPYTSANISIPDRNQSHIENEDRGGGVTDVYYNDRHSVSFDLPYRWDITEAAGKQFGVIIEPIDMEHNVQAQIEKSGFIPKVVVTAEPRDPREDAGVSPAFFQYKEEKTLKF